VLGGGRHVLCEKPLAVTSQETGELAALAASRPRQAAAVNYNVRFYPLCHEMKARIARGDIGRVLSVTGSYTQDWLLLPTDYNWRVEPDNATNLRAVADVGTHWMDLAQFVTGLKIERVLADLATFHPERRKPLGGSETFTGSAAAERPTEPVKIVTEDYGAVLMRLSGTSGGSTTSPSARPGARIAWPSRSPGPKGRWSGTASRRTGSGSAAATGPASCSSATPA
jgi:predicted dehydrogenase